MTTPNRANYANFVNLDKTVARMQELQAESQSAKTRDVAFAAELKLLGVISGEIVKTDEFIARKDSTTESALAIEAAKAANKPKVQSGTVAPVVNPALDGVVSGSN